MVTINPRIAELQEQMRNAQNEIQKIQGDCKHSSFFVMMYSWRIGAFMPSRICDACNLSIPGITEEESKKCWDDWNNQMNAQNISP